MSAPVPVWIATPIRQYHSTEDLPSQIGSTLRELVHRSDAAGYTWEFVAAVGGLCRARNTTVHEFLKSDAKWLLWWDADLHEQVSKNADAILRLLSHKQPIVGGLYCKRAKRPVWVATWLPEAKLQQTADGIVQVQELGGGFKLYHRKVFEELRRIFGELPLELDPTTTESLLHRDRDTGELLMAYYLQTLVARDFLTEDYYLDFLARKAGIPIFADTLVRMRHIDHDGSAYPERFWPPIPAEDAR